MYEHGLALLHIQCVVDALERREAGGRNRAALLKIQSLWYVRDFVGRHRDVLCIVSRLLGSTDCMNSLVAQHKREPRLAVGIRARADLASHGPTPAISIEIITSLGASAGSGNVWMVISSASRKRSIAAASMTFGMCIA